MVGPHDGRRAVITDTDNDWAAMAVSTYEALIADRVHFAEAGYRDGEFYCMLGAGGSNCNGERYTPELGAMLRQTLLEPVGQWCVFWWAHPKIGVRIRQKAVAWLQRHRPDVRWLPDRPIGRANEKGLARPIFEAMARRRIVLVGPRHLVRLTLLPIETHVVVPDGTAWQQLDRITAEVRGAVRPDDLVLFASGMASNVMIWRLWPELRGRATLLDIGAALDPYVGVFSRGAYREPHWQQEIMPRNLPRL